jgi:hypothetical protein
MTCVAGGVTPVYPSTRHCAAAVTLFGPHVTLFGPYVTPRVTVPVTLRVENRTMTQVTP